jgi:hypothetical protein
MAAPPKPGDIAICSDCGGMSFYTKTGMRKATHLEYMEAYEIPEVRDIVLRIMKGNKS